MNGSNKTFIVGVVIAAVLVGSALAISFENKADYDARLLAGESLVAACGLELVDATFNSPDVYIHVDSFEALLLKADAVDAEIVFREYNTYTVVDGDFIYAWQYRHTSTSDIMVPFLLLFAAVVTMLITMFVCIMWCGVGY